MRRRGQGAIVSHNLDEVYPKVGDFSVKMIIDPRESQAIDSIRVTLRNADASPMDLSYRRWGTKLNMTFTIDDGVPDGVCILEVLCVGKDRPETRDKFAFWVIK